MRALVLLACLLGVLGVLGVLGGGQGQAEAATPVVASHHDAPPPAPNEAALMPGDEATLLLQTVWEGVPPPWDVWLRPALFGLAGVALFSLVLLAWVGLLRRQVRRRTLALERERRTLRSVINAIPDLIWVKDPQGRYIACNERFQSLHDMTEAALIGRRDAGFEPPDRGAVGEGGDERILAQRGGTLRVHERLRFARDGHVERVEWLKTALHDEHGTLLGVLGIARDMTAVLEARDSLQAVLHRLEQAERIARLGHWQLDLQQRSMIWSEQMFEILALPTSTVPTLDVLLAQLHADDAAVLAPALHRVTRARRLERSACRLVTAGGGLRHVQVRAEFSARDDGSPQLIGTLQDITEQVLTAQALHARQAIFSAIADQATESIALIDPEGGGFVEFNSASHENLGYSAEAFGRMVWSDIDLGDAHNGGCTTVDKMLSPSGRVIESRHRRSDGAIRDVRISARTIVLQGRQYLAAIWSDITDIKRQTEELAGYRTQLEALVNERTRALAEAIDSLRLANEEQQAIFDAGTVGIVLVRKHMVMRCNRRLEELLGYGPGELVGQSTRDWFAQPQSFVQTSADMEQAMRQGESFTCDLELQRKDGRRFWARVRAHAIVRQQPERGVAGIIEDITLEREALIEMRHARELAETAAHAKSDFLANMSHEIRTPMNAILGMTHLALNSDPTPRQQDYLQRIYASGKHLLQIIDDILDLSRIEAGKLRLEHTEFSVEALMQTLANLIGERASDKGLELIFDIDPAVPPWLIGDPLRLSQVLINYANNAVKFTERGEISVMLRLLARTERRVHLRFSVRDTGIGVSEADLGRLFMPFEQADAATTRQYGGAGLGLSIARRLVQSMGGEVGASSRVGEGSTFWFSVWLEMAEADRARRPVARGLEHVRALVVDDSDHARLVITRMLAQLGVQATGVGDGPTALQRIEAADQGGKAFALVLLDQNMRGLDGLQTASAISALSLRQSPKLILLARVGYASLGTEAQQAGVSQVLTKPLSASDLADAITVACDAGEGAPARAGARPPAGLEAQLAGLAGARLLLVEDNEVNRQVAHAMLEAVGFVVEVADNGLQAVERIRAGESFDLIFMDMQMPVMNGLQATREIRALPRAADVPIVAMTANVMPEDRAQCLAAGMSDFVPKPIDPQALWAVLLEWVPARGAGLASPGPPSGTEPALQSDAAAQAAPRQDQACAVQLLAVRGLDAAQGLSRCAGRLALYRQLLIRFVNDHADCAAQIAAALAAGDTQRACNMVHALRGVAGNLGAVELERQADVLEQRLAGAADPAARTEALAALGGELSSLLDELCHALGLHSSAPAQPDGAEGMPAEADRARLLLTLAHLLDQGDPAVRNHVQRHADTLRTLLADDYPSFAEAIEAFDFEHAASLLPH